MAVPRPREVGLRLGRKFLDPPYYSQRAVFASLWALFSLILVIEFTITFHCIDKVVSASGKASCL